MHHKIEILEQRGFTLIELLVVMAILTSLGAIMAMTFSLVTKVGTGSAAHNVMLAHVHLAGNWITRDVESAKIVTVGPSPALCTMKCYRWNGTDNITDNTQIIYRITTNTNGIKVLTRKVDTNPEQQIAEFISSDTTFTPLSNHMYELNIKAAYNTFSLNKIYKAEQRYPQ
jgi:prepilin-type N-terminal cleavage/methylation domain-containing protein